MERRPRLKWIVGGALIVLGIGGLAAWALASPGAVSYYTTPSELRTEAASPPGRVLRLGGRVADGGFDRSSSVVRFTVTDGHEDVRVLYRGEVPDTLKPATDVIAEGTLAADGTLHATRVLAKCSSKFVPVEEAGEQLGRKA